MISRRVLFPTPRNRERRRNGTVSRSSTVSKFARSRALVARVPRPSSWTCVSRVALASNSRRVVLVFVVRERSRLFEVLEAVPPFPEHLLGVIEALGDVAAERLAEELGEPLPQAGVEQLRIDA